MQDDEKAAEAVARALLAVSDTAPWETISARYREAAILEARAAIAAYKAHLEADRDDRATAAQSDGCPEGAFR